MLTLSAFERRLTIADQVRDVALEPGQVRWLDAQSHTGENIGATDTHVVFVELKEPGRASGAPGELGPSSRPVRARTDRHGIRRPRRSCRRPSARSRGRR